MFAIQQQQVCHQGGHNLSLQNGLNRDHEVLWSLRLHLNRFNHALNAGRVMPIDRQHFSPNYCRLLSRDVHHSSLRAEITRSFQWLVHLLLMLMLWSGDPCLSASVIEPDLAADNQESLILTFVGDLMPASHVAYYLQRFGPDYPYRFMRPWLDASELTVCNLELPVTDRGSRVKDKKFTFRMQPSDIKTLTACPVHVCTLANNHLVDYGPVGVLDTIRHLDEAGIFHAGAGKDLTAARRPAIVDVMKGKAPTLGSDPQNPGSDPKSVRATTTLGGTTRVALLAYSKTYPFEFFARNNKPGTADGDDNYLASDIKKAKTNADLVVVCVHWGTELMTTPKPYQIDYAHLAVDLGADLVIGHHPHVLQPFEVYKGKLIAYSLGNFVFGSYSRSVKDSCILRVMVENGTATSAEIVPISVDNVKYNFQPRPLQGDAARKLLTTLGQASSKLHAPMAIDGDLGKITIVKL